MKVLLTNPTRIAASRVKDLEVGAYFYTTDPKKLFIKAYGLIVELLNGTTHTMKMFREVLITPVEVETIHVKRL